MSLAPARLPAAAVAAYAELKRSLLASPIPDLRGSPSRVQRGGKVYWYDSYRLGTEVRKTYLGEDSDALRTRLLRARALAQAEEERKAERTRLVRLLRAEGLLGVTTGAGSLLAALAAAGAFQHGLTLIGAVACRLYEGELGIRLSADESETQPLLLALPAAPSESLLRCLADFAFDPVPALRRERAWRWRQARGETMVRFKIPADDDAGKPRYIKALGVYAEQEAGLAWLTSDAIPAAIPWRSGIIVRIPRPERFAVREAAEALTAAVDPDRLATARQEAAALTR
jgi:hypothetical protein